MIRRKNLTKIYVLSFVGAASAAFAIINGTRFPEGPGGAIPGFPEIGRVRSATRIYCTGTLISPRHVLIAKHCERQLPAVGDLFYGGPVSSTSGATKIVRRMEHPESTVTNYYGVDLAVLLLENARAEAPVPLSTARVADGTQNVYSITLGGYNYATGGVFQTVSALPQPNSIAKESTLTNGKTADNCYTVKRMPATPRAPEFFSDPLYDKQGVGRVLIGVAALGCPVVKNDTDPNYGYVSVTAQEPWLRSTIKAIQTHTPAIYAERLVADLVNRQGTDATLESNITSGSPDSAVSAFLKSSEYAEYTVKGWFQRHLGRQPLAMELSSYSQQLIDGTGEEVVLSNLLATDEYFAYVRVNPLEDGNHNYSNALIRSFMGRAPTQAELTSMIADLRSGALTRQGMALSVIRRQESARIISRNLYRRYLRRDPGPASSPADATFLTLADEITGGKSIQDARKDLLVTDEYRNQ